MNRAYLKIYLLLVLFSSSLLFGQSNVDYKDIGLSISFFDSKIYTANDDIRIKITIENNSLSPFSFDLSRDKYDNVIFNVTTLAGEQLEQAEFLNLVNISEKKTFYRTVSILPGEQFSFVQNLRQYKKVPIGIFAVDVMFYPSIDSKNTAKFLRSNRLSLVTHQEEKGEDDMAYTEITNSVKNIIKDKKLAPDEVIKFILDSKRNQAKEKFFLYIDLESLYNANNYQRTLKNMAETDKNKILNQYKDMMWEGDEEISDEYLSRIPTDYSVIKTEYGKSNAKVTVIQKYEYKKFTESKKFVYNLIKENEYWKLVSYTVS